MPRNGLTRTVAVAALAVLALPLGLTPAGATAPQQPSAPGAMAADPVPGAYISPWGSADVDLSPEAQKWMKEEGITVKAIAPFKMHKDGNGFSMPIGSTAGDHLDSKGRIYYPGGIEFRHKASDKTVKLLPTWIRVMPRPGYSAGVEVNGKKIADELMIADTKYAEVMASARPTPTGFQLKKVPFYMTKEASEMFSEHSGAKGPRVGAFFGTLTPHFDYVPTNTSPVPGFPG
ncbi:hypothetical protein [Streptomyces venezuelae]|uniref:hypothetical protein n=1 Tax=Streptomyces venezuelae TaxID=54571 RepID=UPI003656C4ED